MFRIVATLLMAATLLSPGAALAQPTTSLSPESQLYLAYMAKQGDLAAQAMQTIAAQSELVSADPTVMFDPDWQLQMAVGLGGLQAAGEALQDYSPVPPEMQPIDDQLVAAGKEYVAASKAIARGIDTLDAGLMASATQHLLAGNAHVRQATAAMDALGGGSTSTI